MLKPNEIERASAALDKPMKALENQVMEDIIRRIKINGEITRSADWQMNRLYEMGMAKTDIKKAIQDNLNFSDKDMLEMYKKVVKSGYSHNKEVYLKRGLIQVPFEDNLPLQQFISAVAEQTSNELKNISQSLGFAVRQSDGKLVFTGTEEFYQQTLDNSIMGIANGFFDYNTAIKKAVSAMTNSGLRTVDYASGWSNRVDVAARRAVMTGMSQLTAKVNEDNAKALKTEYFEVTWHSGARPSHQVWQGKVYSREQLETVCGLGTVTGLCGANCYHDYFPFVPGISERTYTDKQRAELNAEDNRKREYQGKEYTKYEALQRQRRLETAIRAKREEIHLLELAEVSEDDIINARCRYQGALQEYNRFSREMDLPVQRDRIYVDGWGNIGVGKVTGGSGKKSPIEVPKVGAKVSNKVTPEERLELLKNGVDNSGESGIIKLEDCNDFSHIENYLSKTYDIGLDNSVKSLDFETCKSVLQGAETLIFEYPELGSSLQKVTTSKSGVMCCTGKEICFNSKYFISSGNLSEICKNQSAAGFWVKNSSPASIGVHETAHAIEQLLIDLNSSYDYDWQKVFAWNDCTEAKIIVSQAIKNVKKTAYGKGKTKNELINAISRYASDSPSETMAEAFADVYANGNAANPLSLAIKKSTYSQYLKYKKGGN